MTAVRVAWAPRRPAGHEDAGPRRGAAGRRRCPRCAAVPRDRCRRTALRRDPDRARVVLAEPATVAELAGALGGRRARWPTSSRSQAALALDRAERGVVGERVKVPRHVVEAIEASPEFRRELAALAERLELPRGRGARPGRRRPRRARRGDRPRGRRGVHRGVPAAALPGVGRAGRHRRAGAAARAQPPAPAGLPAQPPLLRRPAGARRRPRRSTTSRATTCSAATTCAFWPVGPLAKRAGIVFIRRSFGDDQVYKLAVREYFAFLLAKRFNLEWYMEGGRSRTGKLRPPRHGLLRYVADAVERGRVDDVLLVPVSITYDQLREVSLMAAEQGGAAKRGEGLSWLASYAREQVSTPLGTVTSRFAEPLSLAAALRGRRGPGRPGRAAADAAEGRVPGRRRDQLGHPGDGDGAGHPRPARACATAR